MVLKRILYLYDCNIIVKAHSNRKNAIALASRHCTVTKDYTEHWVTVVNVFVMWLFFDRLPNEFPVKLDVFG